MSEAQRLREPASKETRNKLSEKIKNKWENPEYRKKQQMGRVHRYQKQENRLQTGETSRKMWEDPEFKKREIERRKLHPAHNKPHTDEAKKKISEKRKGKKMGKDNPFYGKTHSKEIRNLLKDSTTNCWKTEEYVRKQMISRQVRPNGAELFLDSILQNHFPDEWKYVGDGGLIISGLCPDFVNCNGKKKIIELFGEYWHLKKGKVKPTGTEEVRKKIFKELGYDTLFIWESELVDEQKLIEKIRSFSE